MQETGQTDHTHAADAASWVADANGHAAFPIQNLPFGVFAADGGGDRTGVRIGDHVLDLQHAAHAGLLAGLPDAVPVACGDPLLNRLMALPVAERRALRHRLFDLLGTGSDAQGVIEAGAMLLPVAACAMRLPARIGDFTDFSASRHHATAAGLIFRPTNPLMPNYVHMPAAYHGRASSVDIGPSQVRRPRGQVMGDSGPALRPCAKFDYELELAVWIGAAPERVNGVGDVADAIFGYSLLNDWSARDVQRWESQPLGPFLSKSFATSISPWIVTSEALAPFRAPAQPRWDGDPPAQSYLRDDRDQRLGAIDMACEVWLATAAMAASGRPAERISVTNATDLYWTPAQLAAHHSIGGCRLQPGDILGTGTISGPGRHGGACLLEQTRDGAEPITVGGERRAYLEDGDVVTITAHCRRDGFAAIGLGDLTGTVVPA